MALPSAWSLPTGESALHPLLVALIVLLLFVKPMVDMGVLSHLSISVALVGVILAGLFCLDRSSILTRRMVAVAFAGGTAAQGFQFGVTDNSLSLLAAGSGAFALASLAGAIMHQTFASGIVTARRIEGGIAGYLLIGLIFALLYDIVHNLTPDAFLYHGLPFAEKVQPGSYIFFSFVTLTTTGYGDITPQHPIARTLAMFQAVSGQLYIAVLLARLVSLQVTGRR